MALLDLRLLGLGRALPFRPVAQNVLPYLYATFGVTFVTGLLLFFYDPVHVGSHAYFVPEIASAGAGPWRLSGFTGVLNSARLLPPARSCR